jgi:peptidoglycan/LPS O-acetylase OafA/YrhL
MPSSFNRQYLPEVDQLRAFAALLVFFYHGLNEPHVYGIEYDPSHHPFNPLLAFIEEGHSGVGLFIVLSGFILSLGAVGNRINYKSFLIARILRIYPMLLVYLVVAMHVSSGNILNVLTSLLPLNSSGGLGSSFAAMFWAVAIELQCYLIFPFLIAFSNERGSRFLVQLIALGLVLRLLAVLAEGANPREISYWTVIGRIDQFCIGMIAARLFVSWNLAALRPVWLLPSTLAVAFILWTFHRLGGWTAVSLWKIAWPTAEGLMWAFFIVTYIAAGRVVPSMLGRIGAKLGEISYSIYLVHFSVIAAIAKNSLSIRASGNDYYDALVTTLVLALPVTIAIAALTYHTVELPFLQMRPKYIVRHSALPVRPTIETPSAES